MRKPSRKTLVRNLDTVAGQIVKKRDGMCVVCGKTENPTSGHLITRAKYSVRWDLNNVFQQCGGCNLSHEYNPHPFTLWYIEKFGKKAYADLVRKSNVVSPKSNMELTELLATLTAHLQSIKTPNN